MDDEDVDRCGNAGQLLRAIDLGIVDVEADRHATGCDSLAEAIQGRIQSLVWIELGVRDETAGVVEDGMKEDLHLAAAGALDVRAEKHVGLPDLIAVLSFELFVRRRSEELTFGQAALLEEAVEGGRRDLGVVLPRGESKFPKQCGAGTMRVFALEAFDQVGELWRNNTGFAAVLPWLRRQGLKTAVAVTHSPMEKRIEAERSTLGIRDVVLAGYDLAGAPGEFPVGKDLDHKWCNKAIAKQSNFF
jgi:hypothetical protein